MKVWIEIFAEHHDRIAAKVPKNSRLYAILTCGEIAYDQGKGKPKKMIRVFCDSADVSLIIEATIKLCPEATECVKNSIARQLSR
jgi:hypothetical protein